MEFAETAASKQRDDIRSQLQSMGLDQCANNYCQYVYALLAPDDDLVRYIGATKNPVTRFDSHLQVARRSPKTPVTRWISSLIAQGQSPRMDILLAMRHPRRHDWRRLQLWLHAAQIEKKIIAALRDGDYLGSSDGWDADLLNVAHNAKKFSA